jgi:hypothetical protein
MWFPGFSEADANPDLGDSAITETLGLGGMSMASAPAIVKFVGGTAQEALDMTRLMYEITCEEHSGFTIASLDFRGSPMGLDLRKIMSTGILPIINTGVAHKEAGVGMVGAGIVRAPRECFMSAFACLSDGKEGINKLPQAQIMGRFPPTPSPDHFLIK